MGETLSEASALLQAIGGLMPFANGAADNVVIHLRRTLAALVAGDDAPPDPVTTVSREAPRPALNGRTIGVRRMDPSWPGIRDRLRAAMTKRNIGPTALARVVKIPAGTIRKYLAATAPPPDIRARLVAWVDLPAAAAPEASKPPRTPRLAPPPANAQEVTAAPAASFLGSGRPFRMGATETEARA